MENERTKRGSGSVLPGRLKLAGKAYKTRKNKRVSDKDKPNSLNELCNIYIFRHPLHSFSYYFRLYICS